MRECRSRHTSRTHGPVTFPSLRDVVSDIASDWTTQIQQRTRSGIDASGRRFRPRKDGSASTLTASGRMVRSFRPTRVDEDGFTLAPGRGRDATVAYVNQARGRRWIAATPDQISDARDRVAGALRKS